MRSEVRSWSRNIAFLTLALLGFASVASGQSPDTLLPGPKPADIPKQWRPWIGEYDGAPRSGPMAVVHVLAERDGFIEFLERINTSTGIRYEQGERFRVGKSAPEVHGFRSGPHRERELVLGDVVEGKITPAFGALAQVLIKPARPVAELRAEAIAASPPREDGTFRKADLIELVRLEASIHLEIRYATSNDFLGTPVYSQARAFLQRPAAEALLRVQQKLKPLGYGLLIHDAYRPWYVTKIFWDATPPEGKIFVADPAQASRHNRGCAVDLTLYHLASGKPIEMPSTYDEMSPRSFPDYPGGTSLQRWHRDLLRRAMESEGFTVYEAEWWHFDYKDWKEYAIQNVPFEKLGLGSSAATVH